MKNVIINLPKKTSLIEIEKVLEDLNWKKFNPKKPKAKWDYSGLSGGDKITLHLNEKRKTEKDAEKIVEFFHYKPFPKVKYDEYTFQSSYEKAKTLSQKMDILAEWVGLKKKQIGFACKVYVGKEKLTALEMEKIKQYLNSFGVPFRFILKSDGILEILFFEILADEWKKKIPWLVNIWLDGKPIEANFDFDIKDKKALLKKLQTLEKEFEAKNIQVRLSPNKNYHARIINKLFRPKESLKIRKKYGDSPERVLADTILLEKGLRCNFLYDTKYGKPAGKWISLKKWVKENKL